MALILKYPGGNPIGEFDGVDGEVTTVKGGEVGTVVSVTMGSDAAAADADGSDGYVGANQRPAVTVTLADGARPLGLIDDGNSPHYGTLFGSVLGATAGQQSFGPGSTGTVLGPHTAAASGKLTFWTKPGTYGVTLDAVDTTSSTGLTLTNTTLSIGDPLYATASGLLTPNSSESFETDLVVARFLNFETNGSLVTTPVSLVSATKPIPFNIAVIEFAPPIG